MGSSQSKQPEHHRSNFGMSPGASPRHSAAFGRLGNSYSPTLSTRGSIRHQSVTTHNSQSSGGSTLSKIVRAASLTGVVDAVKSVAAATETSPLLGSKAGDTTSSGRFLSQHHHSDDDGLSGADDILANSPPLVIWIGPALACALAYALYNIFIKKGSASINPILGGVILQFVAAILGCFLLGGVMFFNSGVDEDTGMEKEEVLFWDWTGIRFAILAGVAVGAAEMISFCVSGMGVQAMQSIPVIIGGSVLFGTVLGWAALGESLTVRGWSGVILIAFGITLVGLDDDGEGI